MSLPSCVPSVFSPDLFSFDVLAIEASVVENYSFSVPSTHRFVQPSIELTNATFCNVTVTYTHLGENDRVGVEAWLPPPESWNERLEGVGGGGWGAGRFFLSYGTMAGALAEGFATVTTDAGYQDQNSPENWVISSPGHVNLPLIDNFAHRALGDAAFIGKSIVQQFYGRAPSYSYFNGCSQGGRQGYALAQRYPTAYDGIAASAPALYLPELASNLYWPQQYMNDIDYYPYGCEIDAIVLAAVSRCDDLDGVSDGIISDVDKCFATFDPFELVGQSTNCSETGSSITISSGAAKVVEASWVGMAAADGKLWHGFRPGADLSGNLESLMQGVGMAKTNCTRGVCTGSPDTLAVSWFRAFLAKDPSFDVSKMTESDFQHFVRLAKQEYSNLFGTNNPDLSRFHDAGGKLVSFHGLADQMLPDQGTRDYYDNVVQSLPDVHDFYRYFPVPGVAHCFGGKGGSPLNLFQQLRAWVENGTAPEDSPVSFTDDSGVTHNRIVCPYPQEANYDASCGAPADRVCWSCGLSQDQPGEEESTKPPNEEL
ncbi:tannase and feruloyl esterase [Hypoxylon sp. FL1150]|nr:tannase and feruloyl esterase [Hypoxylon sp. FL1150]